jgi:hypothetical protein
MRKIYELTSLYSYVTTVATCDGRVVVAEFNGVQNMGMHGCYCTDDAMVQKALEMSADYLDGRYRLLTSVDDVCANDKDKDKYRWKKRR